MRWQRRYSQRLGLENPDMAGGFAWLLPEKDRNGKPAELPPYVVQNFCPEEVINFYASHLGLRVRKPTPPKAALSAPAPKAAKIDWDNGYTMRGVPSLLSTISPF